MQRNAIADQPGQRNVCGNVSDITILKNKKIHQYWYTGVAKVVHTSAPSRHRAKRASVSALALTSTDYIFPKIFPGEGVHEGGDGVRWRCAWGYRWTPSPHIYYMHAIININIVYMCKICYEPQREHPCLSKLRYMEHDFYFSKVLLASFHPFKCPSLTATAFNLHHEPVSLRVGVRL